MDKSRLSKLTTFLLIAALTVFIGSLFVPIMHSVSGGTGKIYWYNAIQTIGPDTPSLKWFTLVKGKSFYFARVILIVATSLSLATIAFGIVVAIMSVIKPENKIFNRLKIAVTSLIIFLSSVLATQCIIHAITNYKNHHHPTPFFIIIYVPLLALLIVELVFTVKYLKLCKKEI